LAGLEAAGTVKDLNDLNAATSPRGIFLIGAQASLPALSAQRELLRPFPVTTNHLVYFADFVAARSSQSLTKRNWFLLIIHTCTFTFRMAGRSPTDDALINVESRLVQPPSLVRAIVTRLQVNGSIVPGAFAQDVEAPIILHVADFQVDTKLGHGPLLADLTRAALSL